MVEVKRVLDILKRGLPDVVYVKLPHIPPDHIMVDGLRLSRETMAVLIVLAQDQEIISLKCLSDFLLGVRKELGVEV